MNINTCFSGLRVTLAGAVALALAACGAGSSGSGGAPGSSTAALTTPEAAEQLQPTLKSFESADPCAELKEYLSDFAQDLARRRLVALRDAAEFPMPLPAAGGMVLAASAGGDAAAANARSASATAATFTTTNVQTAGIDELDTSKNNGSRLYRLHDDGLAVSVSKARYWPANALALEGNTALPAADVGNGQRAALRGMFLTEQQQLVVMRSLEGWMYPLPAVGAVASLPVNATTGAAGVATLAATTFRCIGPLLDCVPSPVAQRTYVDLLDGAGAGAPLHQAKIEVAGRLIDSRRIGQRVWIVTQESLQFPQTVSWWPAGLSGNETAQVRQAAMDELIAQNGAAIRAAPLSAWLPADVASELNGSPSAAAAACRSVRRISEPTELGWLRITSLNLDDRTTTRQLVLADANVVYASARALYVATPSWRAEGMQDPGPRTYVHKFAIRGDGAADYVASGAFAGQPLDAYSFDENEQGVLRFASAALRTPDESAPERNWQSYTYLGLIAEQAGKLNVTARTAAIAPGERMQSVRFVGPRAYLVTFRQVDPFFVYQMDAAGGPAQLGELKLPGFSTYLHPIGDRHVLGIGYADDRWPRQIKATLFDVTDPANPREQSGLPLGDVYSASEALWNPHAFNYLARSASSGVMAIPLWTYRYGTGLSEQSSLKLVDVSAERGLSLAGEVSVDDLILAAAGNNARSLYVRRSILTPDHVFAVGDRVLRSAALAAPSMPLDTLIGP